MKRSFRSLIALGVFSTVGGGFLLPGCTDDNSTLFIDAVLISAGPPTCLYTADPSQPIRLAGTLDVAIALNYYAVLLVGNQYTPRGQKQNLKIETTRVNLRGAEITITDANGNTIKSFSIEGSGFVDSNSGETPGWGLFAAELIPATIGETYVCPADGTAKKGCLNVGDLTTVYTTTRVYGDSLGNQSITSGALTYPITVCNGCLLQFPPTALDSANNDACQKATDSTPTSPCRPGNDDPVDCRYCEATNPTCRCGTNQTCISEYFQP